MNRTFHPECFVCAYCGKIFANSPFYLEDGLPYCEEDWNELFTTKCISCGAMASSIRDTSAISERAPKLRACSQNEAMMLAPVGAAWQLG